jgi:hypothetical protein
MVVNSGGWYSKHIYMGSQRIASKLGSSGIFTDCNPLTDTTAYEKNYVPKLDSLTSGIKTRYALCLSPLINWTNLIIQFRTLILGCYEQITKKIQFRREASDYS